MLADVAPLIRKLAYGHDLTTEEARRALNTIGAEDRVLHPGDSDGLYFLALTLGVMAKGPTSEELRGFVASISDQSVHLEADVDRERLIDLAGTGGDQIKTFNVSTTASFIVAAAGGYVAKQAARGYTGLTGSADIYAALGIDVRSVESDTVVATLEKIGIAAFYTPAFSEGFRNRIDFLTKLKTIGLTYPTPWHLVSWVYSPFSLGARLYGVYDERYLEVLAQLFSEMGCRRAMVVHGMNGLDEISNIGETKIAEVRDGQLSTYLITPEEWGVRRAAVSEIQSLEDAETRTLIAGDGAEAKDRIAEKGRRQNLRTFFEVIYGVRKDARHDLALMNAGAGIYLVGLAATPKEGVALAARAVDSGAARHKLADLVDLCGDKDKLKELEKAFEVYRN
jgi:anthranilate phosphoribosyltransferase